MRRRKRFLLSIAITGVSATAACASAGRVSYDAMVSDYRVVEGRRQRGFDQAARALQSERLRRRALVRAVLDRNPSLESVRRAWSAALARYQQAGAYDDPMLKVSIAPLSISSSRAPFGYDVEIDQRIRLGGKLDAQAAIAVAQAQAAGSDYAEARRKLALIASELFDDYCVAVGSLEIQTEHVALMTTLEQNANAAYESGRAAAQDALQAEAELARLEYQRTVYETQRDVAVAQINALLHREPGVALPPPAPELSPHDDAAPDVATLLHEVERRPDIASAQAQLRVARAREAAADSELYPDLTVSTSYNSMWSMPEHRWMAGVALDIPWQRDRRHAAVDEASAVRAASESDVQSITDSARSEVAIALRQLQQARRAVELFEQRLLPVARDRIEAARAGFMASQTNFMSVIEAERGLREAELDLAMAQAELGKRKAALERSLGRVPGLEGKEDAP